MRAAGEIAKSRRDMVTIEGVVNMVLEDAGAEWADAGDGMVCIPVAVRADLFDAATDGAGSGEERQRFSEVVERALRAYLHPGR
jgi:hypothetical protein